MSTLPYGREWGGHDLHKKESVETDQVLRDAQVARSIPVRRQVVTRTVKKETGVIS